MNRIKELPDNVKKKIAAGEVIEGPFSVIKELIENSIDAGSTQIDIQVFDSGLKKIVVKDNGTGIHRDDIKLVIAEHATSKIEDVYDIENISSYGFRGEALSSISSISKFTILTRNQNDEIGVRLESSSGSAEITDYAGPTGATVIVENLFFNIPARKKFLKAKRTELRYIREAILKCSLAFPNVGFTFDVDNKRHITLTSVNKTDERVKQVYGKDVLDNLYSDSMQDLKVTVSGYFSRPDFLKPSRSMQILFVNNRPVEFKYLGFILSRAYDAIANRGKYPVAIIFIDIDPGLIDVNIHPSKKEIKFFDQKYIENLIFYLAEKVLNRNHKVDDSILKTVPSFANEQGLLMENRNELESHRDISMFKKVNETQAFNIKSGSTGSVVNEISLLYNELAKDSDLKFFGILFNTYIIVEKNDNLNIIDFHAAHERIIYDTLMEENHTIESQALAFPAVIELPVDEYLFILENIQEFSKIGFDLADFSDNTITISAVPEITGNIDVSGFMHEFSEAMKNDNDKSMDIRKAISASAACHSAKRAGDKLNSDEMSYVIKEAMSGDHDRRCPHGRPFVYTINKNDLERIFKRS